MADQELINSLPQPFLRWAGSKRQSTAQVQSLWLRSGCSRYVEPFAGSASVFFSIRPQASQLSDLNGELIRTFKQVRDTPIEVHRRLHSFPTGREAYYAVRGLKLASLSDVERAARFIYLNRFCFNGLYRTNRKGEFNVPFGAPKTFNLPDVNQLKACSMLLADSDLRNCDFRVAIAQVKSSDFVYLDPPYAVSNRRMFVEYGEKAFSAEDFDELAVLLTRIDQLGAKFLLSYADCRAARQVAQRWSSRRRRVRRHMAGRSGARRDQYELVLSNLDLLD